MGVIVLIPVLGVGCATVPAGDVFELLADDWGARRGETCAANPQTISFSADRRSMYIRWVRPVRSFDGSMRRQVAYDVIRHGPGWVVLLLIGETRPAPDGSGRPIKWRVRLDGEDTFYWEPVGSFLPPSQFTPHDRCR